MESALFILSGNILPVSDLTCRSAKPALLYFFINTDGVLVKDRIPVSVILSESHWPKLGPYLQSSGSDYPDFTFFCFPKGSEIVYGVFHQSAQFLFPSSHLISEIMLVTGHDNKLTLPSIFSALTETFILKNDTHPSPTAMRTQCPESLIP